MFRGVKKTSENGFRLDVRCVSMVKGVACVCSFVLGIITSL